MMRTPFTYQYKNLLCGTSRTFREPKVPPWTSQYARLELLPVDPYLPMLFPARRRRVWSFGPTPNRLFFYRRKKISLASRLSDGKTNQVSYPFLLLTQGKVRICPLRRHFLTNLQFAIASLPCMSEVSFGFWIVMGHRWFQIAILVSCFRIVKRDSIATI